MFCYNSHDNLLLNGELPSARREIKEEALGKRTEPTHDTVFVYAQTSGGLFKLRQYDYLQVISGHLFSSS